MAPRDRIRRTAKAAAAARTVKNLTRDGGGGKSGAKGEGGDRAVNTAGLIDYGALNAANLQRIQSNASVIGQRESQHNQLQQQFNNLRTQTEEEVAALRKSISTQEAKNAETRKHNEALEEQIADQQAEMRILEYKVKLLRMQLAYNFVPAMSNIDVDVDPAQVLAKRRNPDSEDLQRMMTQSRFSVVSQSAKFGTRDRGSVMSTSGSSLVAGQIGQATSKRRLLREDSTVSSGKPSSPVLSSRKKIKRATVVTNPVAEGIANSFPESSLSLVSPQLMASTVSSWRDDEPTFPQMMIIPQAECLSLHRDRVDGLAFAQTVTRHAQLRAEELATTFDTLEDQSDMPHSLIC